MRAQGKNVLTFAAGEPDFNTPEEICESAIRAIKEGKTKYTPSAGIPALREAIAAKVTQETGWQVAPNQVVTSTGAKQALYNTFQLLLNEGDEVILLAPYWMTYRDQVELAGGVPVIVKASREDRYIPNPDQVRAAITPRTRAIVINTPSNPTGAVIPREILTQLVEIAVQHNLWIVSDEIYDKLVYDGEHASVASLGEEVQRRTILINGVSKTYAMTGWRLGYLVAPPQIAQAASNFQDQVTSNPSSVTQYAALAALKMDMSGVTAMREEFHARRDLIVQGLAEVPGFQIDLPGGAFYAFVDAHERLGTRTDVELADFLLEKAEVALVPGSVFEGDGCLRLSYAASRADILEGVRRIQCAMKEWN